MKVKNLPFCTFFYILISFSIFLEFSSAGDTINETQSLKDRQTLVSSGQSFELGFFSPGESKGRYLGIWYKNSPSTVVWVANKEKEITDSYGVLSFRTDGNLVVLNQSKGIIWSSSLSRIIENPVVQLLESGNLVLREKSVADPEGYIWQSFDFPCHTLLPGMKFGWNSKTRQDWYLTSWRSASNPSSGDFTWRIDTIGLPQVILRKGSEKKFCAGPWIGSHFSGDQSGILCFPYKPISVMIADAVVPTAFAEFMISQFVSAWMGLFLDCRMNGNYLFGPEDVLGEHHWIAKKGNGL
ncbi:G-type lectin S-receptor-like serine/threonine-protein kinase [Vitis vinifera]|uniref:G-type lectin S-receptor-like serine/threonine-protein kinase n=1 Tax=Vitis vinifera TaxID=29760 RepID=A0A438GDQ1_VITVI|nr:G-type lectin S-receptor-like serine/threonine-protein kinase [Vitis vinifera]